MRRKSKKISLKFIITFVIAIALSLLLPRYLPIPKDVRLLVIFLLIPALSAAGILIQSRRTRR